MIIHHWFVASAYLCEAGPGLDLGSCLGNAHPVEKNDKCEEDLELAMPGFYQRGGELSIHPSHLALPGGEAEAGQVSDLLPQWREAKCQIC